MAIVDMKRFSVLVMRWQHEPLLKLIQRCGCMQFVPVSEKDTEAGLLLARDGSQVEESLSRLRWAINSLSKYDKVKQSMLKPLPEVSRTELDKEDTRAALSIVGQVEALERSTGDLRGHETRVKLKMEQLQPWLALDIPPDQICQTITTRPITGQAPTKALQQLMADWQGRPAVIYSLDAVRDSTTFFAVVHQSHAEELLSDLRAIGYQQAAPLAGEGTPRQQYDQLRKELSSLSEEEKKIELQLMGLAESLPKLRLAYESFSAEKARFDALSNMAHSQMVSLLTGWVPAHLTAKLEETIKADFPEAQIAVSDPLEGEEPPVLLKNQPLIEPYEAVVEGFSLPAPGSVDPTSVMMPFFACFFGMMVSDAGYGLLMAALIPFLIKAMKPSKGARKIFWILCGGGILTVFWGALYNTWFGFGPWPSIFDPVNDSLPVMAVCVGVGALHLFAGLGVGIYQNIKRGQPLDALYDQVSWMLLVIGLGLLALPQTAVIGKWMAIAGAGIVLLTAGRGKSKNPVKRLISGLGALYGVTSWISDLLSYMRLFGMGLATGVIGMVINQLVGMIMGGGIIGMVIGAFVFVGAHLFNAAINILGAYVHACRLQYIEFFGKFYEEGGKPFKPLRVAPRYLRVVD